MVSVMLLEPTSSLVPQPAVTTHQFTIPRIASPPYRGNHPMFCWQARPGITSGSWNGQSRDAPR